MLRCTHSHTYPAEDVRWAHKGEPPHLATMSAEERAYRVSYDFFHSAMLRVHVHERQDLAVEPVRDRDVDVTHALIVEMRTPSNPRIHASASSRMRLINRERTVNPQETRETESPRERRMKVAKSARSTDRGESDHRVLECRLSVQVAGG